MYYHYIFVIWIRSSNDVSVSFVNITQPSPIFGFVLNLSETIKSSLWFVVKWKEWFDVGILLEVLYLCPFPDYLRLYKFDQERWFIISYLILRTSHNVDRVARETLIRCASSGTDDVVSDESKFLIIVWRPFCFANQITIAFPFIWDIFSSADE